MVIRIRSLMFAAIGMLLSLDSLHAQNAFLERQQAVQRAVASVNESIVRIETVGGIDLVGEVLTGTGPTTGVIVSEDGYIITSSFNFVGNPASVLVTMHDEQRLAAKIVASDKSKMLTLLKIESSGLKPVSSTRKNEIQVGQTAIALGRTFEVSFPNISVGIVSALNRVQGKAIQTDAKCSPINYGGPLIGLNGECLGVIVPLSPQQEGESAGVEWYDSGIGFAIPLEDILRVLDRLQAGENLNKGLLGVGFETAGPLSGEAKVLRVRPQSPAAEAGIQVDDVIIEIDGQPIRRLIDLQQILGNHYAGETVKLAIKRGEETFSRDVALASELLAFEFRSIGFLPDRIETDDETGVGVRHVFEQTGAEAAGLKAEDRILSFNGEAVETTEDLAVKLSGVDVGQDVELGATRDGQVVNLKVKVAPFPNEDGATNVPPPKIPRGQRPEGTKVGRFNQQLPGSDRSFWVNVPDTYSADYRFGMLVWVHPAGDTQEAELLKFWKDFADERGIILVGPRAEDISGWSPTDEEHVKDVVEWVRENYATDPARIAVMGLEDSGAFATRLAFKYRDLFRGLISYEAPLRSPPPDNEPNHRLLIAMVGGRETRQRMRIEKSVELLRDQKFPTALIDSEEEGKFSPDLVNSLIQWLDSLDRL